MSAKKNYAVFVISPYGDITKTIQKKAPPYEAWKKACEGIVQQVPYFTKFEHKGKVYTRGTMYANEEGLLLNLPFNRIATMAWAQQCPAATTLVGSVIYYATTDEALQ